MPASYGSKIDRSAQVAEQLSFESLLDNLLYYKLQKAQYDDAVSVTNSALDHKLRHDKDERIAHTSDDTHHSGLMLEQMTIALGDYAISSKERARRNFSEKTVSDSLSLRLHQARAEVHRHNLYQEQADLATMDPEELQRLARIGLEYNLHHAQATLEALEAVQEDFNNATSYSKYKVVEPQLLKKG